MNRLLALAAIAFLSPLAAQNPVAVAYSTPLSGITTAQASNPITNASDKAMHVIKVEFPTAGGAVSTIQVRVEASYTCPNLPTCSSGTWFPIMPDITAAPSFASGIYAFAKGYGVFPYIRVRSLLNNPGGSGTMTVRYFGHVVPIVPFISQLADRYAF